MSDRSESYCQSFTGEDCASGCLQRGLWTYFYPALTVVGLVLNFGAVMLFRRGSLAVRLPKCFQKVDSDDEPDGDGNTENYGQSRHRDSKLIRFRFSGPGYLFIEVVAINGLFFFLTFVPSIFVRCNGSICGWESGWIGYVLAISVFTFNYTANNMLHWANLVIIIFYGFQRCAASSGKIKLHRRFTVKTSRYCVGFAFQIAFCKVFLNMTTYSIIQKGSPKDNSSLWVVSKKVSENMSAVQTEWISLLVEPSILTAYMLALLISFTYILLKARKRYDSNSEPDTELSDELSTKPNAERERRMTNVYLAISTTYMLSVVFYFAFIILNRNTGVSYSCDIRTIVAELYNTSIALAAMSVTVVNLIANRIFRSGFGSFLNYSQTSEDNNDKTSSSDDQKPINNDNVIIDVSPYL